MKMFNNTIKSLVETAVKSGISRIDAYYLMTYITKKTKEKIIADINNKISGIKVLRYNNLLRKRLKGIPSNYITGLKEFYSLDFKVNRAVLIPRPETELLVDEILKLKPLSLLDLGTGSGNIAISVKYNLPECKVLATDISKAALRIAKFNCKVILKDLKIEFKKSDFCENVDDKFDVIVSNPPYIPDDTLKGLQKEVSKYEPMIALSGGVDGLRAYLKIFYGCKRCLKEDGVLMLEVSNEVLDGVKKIANNYGWVLVNIINDYSNIPRVSIFKLNKN